MIEFYKKNKKIILAILMSIFSFETLFKTNNFSSFNVWIWMLLPILIYFFFQFTFKENEYKKDLLILASIFSLLLVFGQIIYSLKYNPNVSFIKELLTIRSLIYLIGSFNIIFTLLNSFVPRLINLKNLLILKNKISNHKCKYIFIISFLLILIAWSIYFIAYFPGLLSSDSISEIKTIINNFSSMSNHHPIIHTLFVAGPFNLGLKLFNNINWAIALSSIFQMLIMASIFAYLITFLYQRKVKNWLLILVLLFFMVIPMHGYYSITMWKDVLFAGTFLLLIIELIKMLEKKEITVVNSIPFMIISLLNLLFRNNALYAYLILIIFTFIILKKYYKQLIFIFGFVLSSYFIITYPIFNLLKIEKSKSSEYIAIPLQQIGRMAYKNIEFTKEEKETIDELIPANIMKEVYSPENVDTIKFNNNYNYQVFDANKKEYLELWLKLVVKHPGVAMESYLTSTIGYWYPNNQYTTNINNIYENEYGIHLISKFSNLRNKLENLVANFPLINIFWSIGLCFWLMLLFAYIVKKRKGWKYILPFVPAFGIWLTMMLASPACGEFRYVYCAFVSLPLLIIYPFILSSHKDN